jgi:acetyl esterase/lipase
MTIAPVIAAPARPATHDPIVAPPATLAAIRYAAQCPDLDELIPVGLALHLFTEIVYGRVDLSATELHRATTVLTKQVVDALIHHAEHDALRTVLRLVTDGERESMPDGRTARELCREAWPTVRCVAYSRAEQSIRGADDFGVEPMLRLAASRAIVDPTPWWGTPAWRKRLHEFKSSNTMGALAHLTLGTAPEYAPEQSLWAIVA